MDEGNAWVHQDLRDTKEDWFYWCFRVTDAGAKTMQFHFTQSAAIAARGPAVSMDGGQTWNWLGAESVDGNSFKFKFPEESHEVFFGMTIPYTGVNLQDFLHKIGASPFLAKGTLCLTPKGRPVEKLRIGCLNNPKHRVLLTARHHSCETMASFALEGVISFILQDRYEGDWLRRHVEFLVIPLMDTDGVEAGDQGKLRKPHDHNRDYKGDSIHAETAALRLLVPEWSQGRLGIALDFHCPWLRNGYNEVVYLVGNRDPAIWRQQQHFASILERVKTGPLPFFATDNLPFGKEWNTGATLGDGSSFIDWIAALEKPPLASPLEIPYANAHGVEVNPDSARRFGADVARSIALHLRE